MGISRHRYGLHGRKTYHSSHLGVLDPSLPTLQQQPASAGRKHWGRCSGHQLCSEAFQVGAGVWKGSACCIRQLSPAKVRAVLVTKCLLKPSPPPDPCSRLRAPARSAPARRSGGATQSEAALCRMHTCPEVGNAAAAAQRSQGTGHRADRNVRVSGIFSASSPSPGERPSQC